MRLKDLDLIITTIIATMNVVWVLLPSHSTVIGIILALPLVFVLPGYTLAEAFFYKRSFDLAHRLVFSLGLSLTIDIVSGFILNLLPGGLQSLSWALFLGLLTIVLSLLVAYLRRGAQLSEAQPARLHSTVYTYILFGLATIVATLSVVYSAIGAAQQQHPGFTQLWLLPTVQSGNSCAVRVGMRSSESTEVKYRIIMTMNSAQVHTWPSVSLAPQEQWEQTEQVTPGPSDSVFVEVRLYRLDKPQVVYRTVNLTLYVVGRGNGGTKLQCSTLQITPTP